jgi:hypothetical protein
LVPRGVSTDLQTLPEVIANELVAEVEMEMEDGFKERRVRLRPCHKFITSHPMVLLGEIIKESIDRIAAAIEKLLMDSGDDAFHFCHIKRSTAISVKEIVQKLSEIFVG